MAVLATKGTAGCGLVVASFPLPYFFVMCSSLHYIFQSYNYSKDFTIYFQLLFKAILDKCIFGKKVIRRPAVFEADSEGHLPGTEGYRTEDGSFLCNLVKKPKLVSGKNCSKTMDQLRISV